LPAETPIAARKTCRVSKSVRGHDKGHSYGVRDCGYEVAELDFILLYIHMSQLRDMIDVFPHFLASLSLLFITQHPDFLLNVHLVIVN
jgi:hypothetical protein